VRARERESERVGDRGIRREPESTGDRERLKERVWLIVGERARERAWERESKRETCHKHMFRSSREVRTLQIIYTYMHSNTLTLTYTHTCTHTHTPIHNLIWTPTYSRKHVKLLTHRHISVARSHISAHEHKNIAACLAYFFCFDCSPAWIRTALPFRNFRRQHGLSLSDQSSQCRQASVNHFES